MITLPFREWITRNVSFPGEVTEALDAFYAIAAAARWQNPQSVKAIFPASEILTNGRVLIDVANQYHLLIKINYPMQAVRVLHFDHYGKLPQLLLHNT
jgi:mRNA-degrading endonuclease HigB of HigAB toxin-antitoxin module